MNDALMRIIHNSICCWRSKFMIRVRNRLREFHTRMH